MQLCPTCHIGQMITKTVPYVQWYDEKNIIVDRIPALVCDKCSDLTYDLRALENLQRLLWSYPNEAAPSAHSRTR